MSNFGRGLSNAEMREAREFERAGLTTISQAVKAFERGNAGQITAWRRQIDEIEQQKVQNDGDDPRIVTLRLAGGSSGL